MTGNLRIGLCALLSLYALTSAPAVSAATVTYCGTSICYEYDDAQTAVALFGQPQFSGDMLRFLPPNFRAQSDDGAGLDAESASFVFDRVYSISGADLNTIMVSEFGDYEITNGDRVSDELTLGVVNNNDALEIGSDFQSFTAAGDSGGVQEWQLDGMFDISQEFDSAANDVKLTITNLLEAETDAFGESAWIQKKLTVMATTVPVPAAVWLMGSALGFLGFMRRRKSPV